MNDEWGLRALLYSGHGYIYGCLQLKIAKTLSIQAFRRFLRSVSSLL